MSLTWPYRIQTGTSFGANLAPPGRSENLGNLLIVAASRHRRGNLLIERGTLLIEDFGTLLIEDFGTRRRGNLLIEDFGTRPSTPELPCDGQGSCLDMETTPEGSRGGVFVLEIRP